MASQKLNVKQIPKENRNQKVWSRRAYVDWANKILKAHYTDANEFRNGALYVQLLDSLFPGAIPLDEVKFSAQKRYDCYQNFCILEEAFRKLSINRTFNVQALSEGRHVASWEFLKWFKEFYDKNFVEKDYDPLKARKNAYMGYGISRNTIKSDAMKNACEKSKNVGSKSRSNTLIRNISKDKSENVEENLIKEKKPSPLVDFMSEKVKGIFKESKVEENSSNGNELGQSSSTNSVKTLTETANIAKESNAVLTSIGSSSRNRFTGKSQGLTPLDNGTSKHCHTIIPESATRIATGAETNSKESTKSLIKDVIIKYAYSHGDFERKYARKAMSEGSNVHSIVFDKTATYDEFKINISDNIKIRFEDIKNAATKKSLLDPETRRKINVMVENFLEFQWVERKDYLDSIVEFLRR